MKGIVDIQSALVSWLKVSTVLPTHSNTFPTEIRELEWQGQKFQYPNIRVRVHKRTFTNQQCTMAKLEGSVFVFSELPSSLQCNSITDDVVLELQGKSFSVSGTKFSGVMTEQFAADRKEKSSVWESEVQFSATVSG